MSGFAKLDPAKWRAQGPITTAVPIGPGRTRGGNYRPELDSLRFAAFLGVFVFHALWHDGAALTNLPPVLSVPLDAAIRAGAFGVDLFFCMSAFLITRLLISEAAATGRIDLWAFYLRRILRIWPLYFFAVILYQVFLPLIGKGELSGEYLFFFCLFSVNWAMALGLCDPNASHLWSISFEEQFYLTWPLVIIFTAVTRIWVVAIAMLLIAACARGLAISADATPEMRWMNSILRLDPLAVGALLAVVLPSGFALPRPARLVLAVSGIAILPACLTVFGLNTPWDMVTYPAVAVACGMILVSSLQPPSGGALDNRMTVYLGKISYGLYVYHPICLWIAGSLVPWGGAFLALGLNIGIAALSHRFLEAPFLHLKTRFEKSTTKLV